MILAGRDQGCLGAILVIAAALSIQDPRQRPFESEAKADQAHRRFQDEASDFVAFLKLWAAYQEQARELSTKKLRKWCEDTFLSFARMRDWQDIESQLRHVVSEMKGRKSREIDDES